MPHHSLINRTIIRALLFSSILLIDINKAQAEYGIEHSESGLMIDLSASALDAVDNGVSLKFDVDFAMPDSWLFLSWRSHQQAHRFVISRHALSNRYLVHKDNKPTPAIFRSSAQGMAYISKSVQNLFRGYAQQSSDIQLRVSLNKYELPAPMRLTAFTSSQWNFDSGWGRWQSIN